MSILPPLFGVPLPFTVHGTGNAKANRPAAHLAYPKYPGLVWETSGASNAWVRGQFESTVAIDFAALISTNAVAGTKLRIRLGTTQGEVDGTAPYDSTALVIRDPAVESLNGEYHSFLETGSTVNASWFRIDISDHTGDFRAATIVFAKKVAAVRYYDPGFEFGIDDLGKLDFSATGVATEEIGIIHRTLGFRLGWVTETEYQDKFRAIVERLGRNGLIYVCFDPQAVANRQHRTHFGWLRQLPTATQLRKPGNYGIEFAIRSMI